MATTTTRIFSFVLMMMSFTVLMGCCSSAKTYKVGDSEGWKTANVAQVSGALEYQYCDSTSPKAVYNTGNDVVTLKEPGYHYFITSNHIQCVYGQRLNVLVVHDPSRLIPPPPPRKILPFGNIYKVGDSNEWRVPEVADFYYKWSEGKQFHVGDSLLFYYDYEVDDVLEISGDLKFKACDPTSPVSVHNQGQDLIRLTKPGIHYFISSKTVNCEAGLKLRVVVQPLPKVVPEKMNMSPLDRLIKWLQNFRPQPHH
ncbi:hypothetical protein ARALYDRAFT_895360 [Arabidopsis lyrata subsp. lyrata]|uniref:Phytocyanin domain-containing protein n=1 Tax=Arabidopsis lyrata subsp. lyrata TaxID=81972 RepID=D7KSI8_ARALL|nr:hypothetical protein ARALYDRAFT_895360 [Arabidopsis lyrata subsp. lyrata]